MTAPAQKAGLFMPSKFDTSPLLLQNVTKMQFELRPATPATFFHTVRNESSHYG